MHPSRRTDDSRSFRRNLPAVVILCMAVPALVSGQCLERDGQWPYGGTSDVFVGDIGAASFSFDSIVFPIGATLMFAEVDEEQKIVVTHSLPGIGVRSLDARWRTVAALASDRLVLIRAGSGDPPAVVGEVHFADPVRDLAIDGDRAYVSTYQGLHVLWIGNPAEPEMMAFVEVDADVWDFTVSDGLAYILDFDGTLTVVDVADPAAPMVVGELVPGWEHGFYDVIVGDGLLFLSSVGDPGLSIVDASDPTTPVIVGTYNENIDIPNAMAYWDDRLFLADSFLQLHIVDVSVPESPMRVGMKQMTTTAEALALLEDWILIATSNGLESKTWNTGPDTESLGSYLPGGHADRVEIGRDIVVVGGVDLRILDTVAGRGHRELGSFGASGRITRDLQVAGDTAYWIQDDIFGGESLELVDIRRPEYPWARGRIDGLFERVVVDDGMIFLLAADRLEIHREHPVDDPVFVSDLSLSGPGRALAVADGHAVVAIEDRGLAVIDIEVPEDPALVGEFFLSGTGAAVVVAGDVAFVAGSEGALIAVDLSRPDAPRELGRFDITAPVVDLELNGRCLYLATDDQVLQLDVSNPSDMTIAAAVDAGGGVQDIGIGRNQLAAARFLDGVSMHETGACLCRSALPRLFIPAAGSGDGAKKSSWSTDVVVNNPGAAPLRFEFRFLERGANNAAAEVVGPFELDAGLGVEYLDIVADLFGVTRAPAPSASTHSRIRRRCCRVGPGARTVTGRRSVRASRPSMPGICFGKGSACDSSRSTRARTIAPTSGS
jgi:hypothetical protein